MSRTFTIASAISLLLFAITVVLAIVSFDRSMSYIMLSPDNTTIRAAYLDEYAIGYFRNRNDRIDRKSGGPAAPRSASRAYTPGWNRGVPQAVFGPNERHAFLGISWSASHAVSIDDSATTRVISILKVQMPLLWLIALFGILPSAWLVRSWHVRQADRRREGRCLACGYSLTGNTSGVCPECGSCVVEKSGIV